jgi:hypothetical protein
MENAYIILGQMRERPEFLGHGATVALLFGADKVTGKQLKSMGFGKIRQVDQARTNGDAPKKPTLFVFDRAPSAREVHVAEVIFDGKDAKLGRFRKHEGEPHSIVPHLEGALAERLLKPRNALNMSDMKRNSTIPKRERRALQQRAIRR